MHPLRNHAARALCALCFVLGSALPAPAIILFNKDNSANQSDPGTGVPWAAVGKVTNNSTSLLSGSAVYLGGGWVLTAHHVTVDGTYKFVTFDGVTTYEIDTAQVYQVAPGVDMKVMKLTSTPPITPVTLLSSASETTGNATHIGWGVGRDPSVPLGNQTVTWGNSTTSAKRWGINRPYDFQTVTVGSYTYSSIRTVLGAYDGPGGPVNPDGVGDDESAATIFDSGSGFFQNIGGTWYLIGIATAVQALGTSYFSDDSLVSPADDPGHVNIFARVSPYYSDIVALIPEPGSVALFGAAAAVLALRSRRRNQPGKTGF